MNTRSQGALLPSLILIACVLAACKAKLIIEVDVYKGPLANEVNVQYEELSAMAIAAQPILVHLRDELEVKHRKYKNQGSWKQVFGQIQELQAMPWYRGSWFSTQAESVDLESEAAVRNYEGFLDPWASRIHAILSLYEDSFEDPNEFLVYRILGENEKFASAVEAMTNPNQRWIKLRTKIDAADPGTDQAPAQYTGMVGHLDDLFTGITPAKTTVHASQCLVCAKNHGAALGLTQELLSLNNDQLSEVGANYAFQVLQSGEFQSAVGASLSGDEAEQAELAELLSETADDYFQARSSIEEILRSALLYLADYPARLEVTEDFGSRGTWSSQRRAFAELVTETLSLYYLRIALSGTSVLDRDRLLVRSPLEEGLTELHQAIQSAENSRQQNVKQAEALLREKLVEQLTSEDGREYAMALLSLHERFIWEYTATESNSAPKWRPSRWKLYVDEPNQAIARSRRRFGLAIGPFTESVPQDSKEAGREFTPTPISPSSVLPANREQTLKSALGLDRGRLPKGLNSLTEAAIQAGFDSSPLTSDRVLQMTDAMVRFAEKLRIIGTFHLLAREQNGAQQGGDERVGRMRGSFVLSRRETLQELQPYTLTLAAISNSIMTTANFRESVREYDDRNSSREKSEKAAAAHLKINEQASGFLPKDSKTALDVIDEAIAALEYERASVLAKSEGPNAAKGLSEAIDRLMDRRASRVHIRPASEFLRSSYLVGHEEDDMEHWEREIARSLDSQYWQRINTVQLKGPGTSQYVLVKDDVGNWYVKGYSADTKDLIRSMKNMAMFAAKGTIHPLALAEAEAFMNLGDGEDPKVESGYAAMLSHLADEEQERADKLVAELESSVQQAVDRLRESLGETLAEQVAPSDEDADQYRRQTFEAFTLFKKTELDEAFTPIKNKEGVLEKLTALNEARSALKKTLTASKLTSFSNKLEGYYAESAQSNDADDAEEGAEDSSDESSEVELPEGFEAAGLDKPALDKLRPALMDGTSPRNLIDETKALNDAIGKSIDGAFGALLVARLEALQEHNADRLIRLDTLLGSESPPAKEPVEPPLGP